MESLELQRQSNGRVDWFAPKHELVYNAIPDQLGTNDSGRKLLLADSYLESNCSLEGGCSDFYKNTLEFYKQHLTDDKFMGASSAPDLDFWSRLDFFYTFIDTFSDKWYDPFLGTFVGFFV
jgi:hypothetical protein